MALKHSALYLRLSGAFHSRATEPTSDPPLLKNRKLFGGLCLSALGWLYLIGQTHWHKKKNYPWNLQTSPNTTSPWVWTWAVWTSWLFPRISSKASYALALDACKSCLGLDGLEDSSHFSSSSWHVFCRAIVWVTSVNSFFFTAASSSDDNSFLVFFPLCGWILCHQSVTCTTLGHLSQ